MLRRMTEEDWALAFGMFDAVQSRRERFKRIALCCDTSFRDSPASPAPLCLSDRPLGLLKAQLQKMSLQEIEWVTTRAQNHGSMHESTFEPRVFLILQSVGGKRGVAAVLP